MNSRAFYGRRARSITPLAALEGPSSTAITSTAALDSTSSTSISPTTTMNSTPSASIANTAAVRKRSGSTAPTANLTKRSKGIVLSAAVDYRTSTCIAPGTAVDDTSSFRIASAAATDKPGSTSRASTAAVDKSIAPSDAETADNEDSSFSYISETESEGSIYEDPGSSDSDEQDSDDGNENDIAGNTLEESLSEPDQSGSQSVNSQDLWNEIHSTQRQHDFIGREKVNISVDDREQLQPYDVFKKIVTDDILDLIVEQTNEYAKQYIDNTTLTRTCRAKQWVPTNRNEMRTFIGIVMSMGLVWTPDIHLYWSTKELYNRSFVSKTMPRDRFLLLLKFLHFSDDRPRSQRDKLFKLRPLVEPLLKNFQELYTPGSSVVIDESLIPFRGRLSFRQYIPGKAHKYGCKLYKLCTPDSYTWNIEIYDGNIPSLSSFGHAESIVIALSEKLLDCGRTVYGDNFYSSVPLAEYLLQRKTYYCGTLRKNGKYCPKDVTQGKVSKGKMLSKQNQKGIKVFNWNDKRNVLMLSSIPEHGDQFKATGKKSRDGKNIMKPQPVIDYNSAKKGVDMSDQMASYHTAVRKTKKWYRKVAFELLTGTSVVNAWVLYNKIVPKAMSMLQFKESLVESLAGSKPTERLVATNETLPRDIPTRHILQEASGQKQKVRKRCKLCYETIVLNEGSKKARSSSKKVTTFCPACEGQPFYCLSCFNVKHTDMNI